MTVNDDFGHDGTMSDGDENSLFATEFITSNFIVEP